MQRHLVNHAVENVWCSPRQDNLHILELHRLTAKLGAIVDVKVDGRVLPLPSTSKRFHVYQIGQLSPTYLGALAVSPNWLSEKWTSFTTAINTKSVQIDIYSDKGIMIPRFTSYYMMTSTRNLIVAVEINDKIKVDLDTEDLFIRFYSNYFFSDLLNIDPKELLFSYGLKITNSNKRLEAINKYNEYKDKEGYSTCFVNGFVVCKLDAFSIQIGDIVEFIYDSTIYKVLTIDVDKLEVFNSSLDNCLKYIVHHKKLGEEFINYQDDIDIDVLYSDEVSRLKGSYYHRNLTLSHRMITHRDYSLPVDHVRRSIDYLKELDIKAPGELESYKLIVKVKESKIQRPLIFDNNRIFELYKLPDELIIQALTGTNSTVENWRADVLESSMYTSIMSSKMEDIDIDMVKQAYGYNAVTTVIADSPIKLTDMQTYKTCDIPIAYRLSSTCYEYDINGLLLGIKAINNKDKYFTNNLDVSLVEFIVGLSSPRNNDSVGYTNIDIPENSFRVYRSFESNNSINNEAWEDITDSNLYEVIDNKVVWTGPSNTGHILAVRSEDTFYARDYDVSFTNGTLEFTLLEDTAGSSKTMVIPRGEIDLFINNKSLIYGLDYMVDFPRVYIYNTEYLLRPLNTSIQKVHVRMTGLCSSDLSLNEADDYGFIRHGALSDNDRFNIRDDKVLRITVDGKLYNRSDLKFDESSSNIDVINSLNGRPYQIKDYVIPVRKFVDEDTYPYRSRSLAIDKVVSDYLTENIPPFDKGPISATASRYKIVSAFLSRVIYKLITDDISDDDISTMVGDSSIIQAISDCEYLLDEDPIRNLDRCPEKEVNIVPIYYNSRVVLSVLKTRFITRVIQLYSLRDIDIRQYSVIG